MVPVRIGTQYERDDWRAWAGLAVRLALGGVFLWASIPKIVDPRKFVQAVRAYQATPEWLSKAIGYGLPVLELSLAALVIVGLLTRWAALALGVLLLVFAIGITQAWARGLKIDCGCFGGGGQTDHTQYFLELLRDVGLLVLVAWLVLWPLTRLSFDDRVNRSEYVEVLTPKQQRNEKAVRRNLKARQKAERELMLKKRYLAGGTAGVIVFVSIIAIGVQGGRAKIALGAAIAGVSAKNGVMAGNQKAPVTVDLYEDFLCPVCKNLEDQGLGKDLEDKMKATSIKVNYHIMSFLDRASKGSRYSTRAANAAYCAAEVSTDDFVKYHDVLYGKDKAGAVVQPAENTVGRTNSDLIRYGTEIGITSADFSSCVNGENHKAIVQGVTDEATKAKVTGTPTVFVAGKEVKGANGATATVADVDAAIADALSHAKSTAAPSPTPATTSGSLPSPTASTATPRSSSTKPKASATPKVS